MTQVQDEHAMKAAELHATSKIVEIELNKLRVDASYQRDQSETLVDEIAMNYDVLSVELPTVSDRGPRTNDPNGVEGGLFIVNGQHRVKGAQKRGLKKIYVRVIDLRKEADPAKIEAQIRLRTNNRLSDRPLERFKAQVRAGDEESLAIVKILKEFGTEINTTTNNEVGINAVSTVEALYRMDEGSLLSDTLKIIFDVYGNVEGKQANSSLLKGVCWFIDKHHEESDRDRLVAKMQGVGTTVLEQRARTMQLTMGGALWINYYRAIVDIYNEKLQEKNRLRFKQRGKQRLAAGGGGNRPS